MACVADTMTCSTHRHGGGRGIRTPVRVTPQTVFKTAGFNHSPIPPTTKVTFSPARAAHERDRPHIMALRLSPLYGNLLVNSAKLTVRPRPGLSESSTTPFF